jgi:hypothetical protein
MINEYDSILANGTWNLVDCPHDVNLIGCKCVYRVYRFLSDGKFIFNGDVIFYETESNNLDEINHLLNSLEKKNTKGKGKLKK